MDQSELAVLAAQGTSAVSDALDTLGVSGTVVGPGRQSGSGAVVGPAFTVEFAAVEPGQPAPAADYLDEAPDGSVVVLANAGRVCTVWGDILSEVALARGVRGTVIDGNCRDIDAIRELGYSVWARGTFMRSGKNRVRMIASQRPVRLGPDGDSVLVRPGDIVCADGAGVVVVPVERLAETARQVAEIALVEDRVRDEVRAGRPLREARDRNGYHRFALPVTD